MLDAEGKGPTARSMPDVFASRDTYSAYSETARVANNCRERDCTQE